MACLRGSYILCMLVMVSRVLQSVKCLHSVSCRHFLPLYVVFVIRYHWEFPLYLIALMISGLWCCGLLCFGSRLVGIIVGCCVVVFSFYSSSWVASRACRIGSACRGIISMRV